MQDHQQDSSYARVRNVPIHVECRDEPSNPGHSSQERHHDPRRQLYPNQPYQNQNQAHQFEHSQYVPNYVANDQRTPPANTSSVNINYRSPSQNFRHQHQHTGSPETGYHHNHSRDHADKSSQADGHFDTVQASQNKENSDIKNQRGGAARAKQNAGETVSSSINVIPLPPPPEQPKTNKENQSKEEKSKQKQSKHQQDNQQELDQQRQQQQQQQQYQDQLRQQQQELAQQQQEREQLQQEQQNIESKKARKDTGPMSVINATKAEALNLLKEITSCNETSLKSKEYIRLDELLTRCILTLDDIQCSDLPELRQQRKAVIELIDKCTDILQRKVKLNHDIQQITARSS